MWCLSRGGRDGGVDLLEFCSFDFLHKPNDEDNVANAALVFGRGGGAADALEQNLQDFMCADEALVCSPHSVSDAGVLGVLIESTGVVLYDMAASPTLRTQIQATHARTFLFSHDDVEDLGRVIAMVEGMSEVSGDAERFIVVEAVHEHTGTVSPLEAIYELALARGYCLVVEESLTVGVLGQTGRGVKEHYALERGSGGLVRVGVWPLLGCEGLYALANGVPAVSRRLQSARTARRMHDVQCWKAMRALAVLSAEPWRVAWVAQAAGRMHAELEGVCEKLCENTFPCGLRLLGDRACPMKLLVLQWGTGYFDGDADILWRVCDTMWKDEGVLLVVARYYDAHTRRTGACIRVTVGIAHTMAQISRMGNALFATLCSRK